MNKIRQLFQKLKRIFKKMAKNISTYGNPILIPIDIYRGDTFSYIIKAYNELGEPFDFDRCSFSMDIKDKIDGNVLVHINNSSFAVSKDDEGDVFGAYNIVTINHSASQMEILNVKKAVYDIEMIDYNGNIITLQRGPVTVRFDVTL